jgi:hypothetical protein
LSCLRVRLKRWTDSGKVKDLEKRIVELDEIIDLLRQDKNRLSHYFLSRLQIQIKATIKSELIENDRPLYDEEARLQASKIVKSVTIRTRDTHDEIVTVSPITASIYSFLLDNTIEDKEALKLHYSRESYTLAGDDDFFPRTLIDTSDIKKTSEAILAYVKRERIREADIQNVSDYSPDDEDYIESRLKGLEKFAKQLSPEQENLLQSKREIFDVKGKLFDSYYELIFNSDGWKYAYRYIDKRFKGVSSYLLEIDLIPIIINSGAIKDEEFLNVFYPNK